MTIQDDVTKAEGLWTKYGQYVIWAGFLILGFVIGHFHFVK